MSIAQSLNNAISGLTASSRQAEVSSSNLANSLTPGYGVRRLDLSSQTLGGAGTGVTIDGITRTQDKGILADRRLADADLGAQSTLADAFTRLETLVGAPDDSTGLAARIVSVETALTAAAADPSSEIRLEAVARQLTALTDKFNATEDGIQSMREAADRDIAGQVATLNTSLAQVEQLNFDIQNTRTSGADPSGLMDQRQLAIDQIAEIVPLRVLDRPNDRVALMTTSGGMLLDGPAPTYSFDATTTIMPHMIHSAGLLSGISRDGVDLSDANGFGKLSGGTLEASFNLRDAVLTEAQTDLDAVARDIIGRVQDSGIDPSRTGTTPGLLTDGGAFFLPADEVGLAGRIALNSAVDPDAGGDLRLIRDGIAAPAGPVGDDSQIARWSSALIGDRALSVGGPTGSSAEHAARITSAIGADRVNAEDNATFATARWSALREAELAGGVDSDAELQMLLRVEQAYAANARVIETVQTMMRALLEI